MSSDLKEQAKKIIAKGKTLNDPELIRMGLEMLDVYEDEPEVVLTKLPSLEPKKNNPPSSNKFDMSQFAMQKNTSTIGKKNRKQPIEIGPRANAFLDDGKEHRDNKNLTPVVELATRNRAPVEKQKVDQKCEVCGKVEKVLPLYAREFYRCESCLLKGKV